MAHQCLPPQQGVPKFKNPKLGHVKPMLPGSAKGTIPVRMITQRALPQATRARTQSVILNLATTKASFTSSLNRPHAKRRHLSSPSIFVAHRMPPLSNPSSSSKREIISFSFDSSGWLYVYHLGVAKY